MADGDSGVASGSQVRWVFVRMLVRYVRTTVSAHHLSLYPFFLLFFSNLKK